MATNNFDELNQPTPENRTISTMVLQEIGTGLIRVLLVEDHPQMREALRSLLAREFEVVDTVGRGDQVLEAAERLRPDVIVLDISLPGRSGLKMLPDIKKRLPQTAVVVLSAHDAPVYRSAALRLGADAFLSKTAVPELLSTVRSSAEKFRL